MSNVLIFGASARAAAFSALRAGLQPWCADLFADADLQARCSALRLPSGTYPQGFRYLADSEIPGPWLYTGGLENHEALVHAMAKRRPLWGNSRPALFECRNPVLRAMALERSGVPFPRWHFRGGGISPQERWLVKPQAGAGGQGIHFFQWSRDPHQRPGHYFQEYIEGESCAAVYVGDGQRARLLGVTQQLVGESWLHAAPFHYCGSIGPVAIEPTLNRALASIGDALTGNCHLRGLFGVDLVLRGGVPYVIEVNPRYTASVEVLEHASGTPALAVHRQVFDANGPDPLSLARPAPDFVFGKAILFARAPLTFPAAGLWLAALRPPGDPWDMPAFADIPHAGEAIKAGHPVLTFFARAESLVDCRKALREMAADLDRQLFGG